MTVFQTESFRILVPKSYLLGNESSDVAMITVVNMFLFHVKKIVGDIIATGWLPVNVGLVSQLYSGVYKYILYVS